MIREYRNRELLKTEIAGMRKRLEHIIKEKNLDLRDEDVVILSKKLDDLIDRYMSERFTTSS